MKLVLCCVLAVSLYVLAHAQMDTKSLMLEMVIKELARLNRSVQHNGLMLNCPTNDIEECCSVSALQCFRTGLLYNLTTHEKKLQTKVAKSLNSKKIVESVNICSQEEIQKAQCQSCDSYQKRDSREFVQQLQSLLQKTNSRLK